MIRFLILFAGAGCLLASPQLRDLSRLYQSLVETVDPSIVQVVTTGFAPSSDGARRGTGSGVIVDPSGYIITNAHVVGDARRIQVLLPVLTAESRLKSAGKLVPAQVIGADRETDLAVLKVEGANFPSLPFADSDQLRQGQLVLAFGSPYGLENSVSMGVISSVSRQVRPEDPLEYLQTDASINPGNSGGPLVDTEGHIAGINTFILTRTGSNDGVGFAAPSNTVRLVYDQIRKFGRVRRGQIGILPQTVTPALAQALRLPVDAGVILADVTPSGAARAAGLQIDDIIVRAAGKPMENARQLGAIIYQSAGLTIPFEVLRAGKSMSIPVAVLERPKDPDRLLSLVRGEQGQIPQLGILAVDLDERVTPLLPPLRRLSGAVVAFASTADGGLLPGDLIYSINGLPVANAAELKAAAAKFAHGEPVALYLERQSQLQYVVLEAQ